MFVTVRGKEVRAEYVGIVVNLRRVELLSLLGHCGVHVDESGLCRCLEQGL